MTCVPSAGVATTPQSGLISSLASSTTLPVSTVDTLSKWILKVPIYLCGLYSELVQIELCTLSGIISTLYFNLFSLFDLS